MMNATAASADGRRLTQTLFSAALVLVLVGSLVLVVRLTLLAAELEQPPAFAASLPYRVIDVTFAPPRWVAFALVAVGAVQGVVLWLLYRALRDRAVSLAERAVLAAGAVLMLALALQATVLSGFDAYAYAGYAQLPSLAAAYAPPATRLPGTFGVVNDVWGTPLVPCYYGPLWYVASRLVAGGASSLGNAIAALRLLEVLALAAVVGTLGAWRRDTALVALVALNPAIYALYVTNAHNDLLAVAFLLGAVALARKYPLAAALGVTAAALIKVPFLAAALYVFAGRGDLVRRLAWVAFTVVLALGASLAFGGLPYVHDLLARLHQTTASGGALNLATARAIKTGLLVVAAIVLVTAFTRGTVWRAGGWSLISLGSLTYPWYLIWTLPYAALERSALVLFLVPLPLAAAMLEPAFPHVGLGQAAMLAILIASAYEMIRSRRATG